MLEKEDLSINKQAKIIIFSCLYMLGIITFFFDYSLILASVILFFLFIFSFYKKLFSIKYNFLLVIIFCLGFTNSGLHLKLYDDLVALSDKDLVVRAKVLTIPSNSNPGKTKFYAKIISIELNSETQELINAKSYVTIQDSEDKIKNIKIGDTLELTGRVKLPLNAQNPSQFDYARYLQFKNTFSLIYVKDNWKKISEASDFTGKFLSNLNDMRTKIIGIHANNIQSPMLEILGGIIFGDDAVNPDENTKNTFINSGIFHILAASGMNVTLIFGIWFFFARSLRLNYRFSIIAGMALILFYTCMTGFGPPIIRASLMLILILLGKLIDRTASTTALLFLVAFIMLMVNPLMIFDIGFQMSFIVTFALILTAPLLSFNIRNKIINYTLGACCIPVIAQLYAAPLQMFYFNTFSLYSVLANIAIIPVLSLVSFIGFISSIIALIPAAAQKICFIADFILNPFLIYIVKVAEFFANLPSSIIYVPKPSLLQLLLYFSIIIFLTCIFKYKLFKKKILISLSVLIFIFAVSFINIPDKNAEILFFSVGNADAILLKSPDNKYFLIDTGKLPYLSSSSQAKNIIIKYLRDNGVRMLDSLIITHFDADHAGGSIDILKAIPVNRIFLSEIYEDTKLSHDINKYIKDNNLKPTIVANKETIYNTNDFTLTIFKPSGSLIETENQNSLIVYCKYKNKKLLFMGDGDINSFNTLPFYAKHHITVLKSGHHGADNTLNRNMLKETDYVVISTGTNYYNHPHPETINLLEENQTEYYRTDRHNAVKFIFKDNAVNIYIYSPKYRKFVKTSISKKLFEQIK